MKKFVCLALICRALGCATGQAATFTVTTTNASGSGSLSNAIFLANGTAAQDTIEFNIPGAGVQTITLSNALPNITNSVILDGYTQPGTSSNTLANGNDAVLLIELSGNGGGFGLNFLAGVSNCVVRGLVLNDFSVAINFDSNNNSNVVEGCFIGTDATGMFARANGSRGIRFGRVSGGANNNRIGGSSPGQRNVIAASNLGILIFGGTSAASNNVIQGNFIGTDATGTNYISNGADGVSLDTGTLNCLVGGTNTAARNVIAGNGGTGIACGGAGGHVIQGNFIGTDVTGTKALGFATCVSLNSPSCIVGGLTPTPGAPPGNVIADGNNVNLRVFTSSNVIQGNLIGTDATGTLKLGIENGVGIAPQGTTCFNNLIGGTNAGAGNVISGNGIGIGDANSSAGTNVIQGNRIGTDITGVNPLPNSSHGVQFREHQNILGPGNIIAFNGNAGVLSVNVNLTNRITANSIFANNNLGIDHSTLNVNENDAGDTTPPQNFPVITGVSVGGGNVTLSGTLNSRTNEEFRLEFFSNASCDSLGNGEGQVFLGFTNVTTDASGNTSFTVTLPNPANHSTFTAMATSARGNTSQFSDCAFPSGPCTIICPSNMVVSTSFGQCSAVVTFLPTTSGNCGAVVSSPPSGFAFPKGTNTVTCTAAGTNCSFTIIVKDMQLPIINCSADIVTNVPAGQPNAVVTYVNAVVAENCPGVTTFGCTPPSGSVFPAGTTTVTCSAVDSSGNSNACSFTVTVLNTNQPPVAQCQDVTVNANANCQAFVGAMTVDNGSSDPDGTIVNRTLSPPGPFPKGTNVVTLRVVDNAGASDTCSATIIVADIIPPAINCPANIVTNVPPGQTNAVVNYPSPAVGDNCPGVTTNCTPPSGSVFPLGVTTVTCTATDSSGNSNTCSFTVTVAATNTPPVALCRNVTTNANASCQANVPAAAVDNGSSDPDGNIVSRTLNPPGPYPKGTNQVTLTVVDNLGGSASCTANIIVADTTPPTITCPANIVTNVPAGQTNAVVNFARPAVTENCPPATTTNCTPPSGSVFPLGVTTVTCTATDSSGNSNTCSFTVTVLGPNTPPVAQCRNVTTNANSSCQAAVAAAAVDNGSSDSDGTIASRTLSPPGPYPKGTNLVTLTVVDNQGASNSCTANIIVMDTTPPTITCPANIATNVPPGQTNAVVNYAGPAVTENCSGVTTNCTPPPGSVFPLGVTTVTCTAIDSSGNSNTCSFTVTVAATNTPPVALCRNVTTNANASCQANVPAAAVDNGSSDPDGTIVTRTLNPPGPYPKGTNAVTLTVVDNLGGSNACAANIIVVDTTPPTIACPANIVTNAPHGQSSLVVNFAAATVSDNCPGTPATGTCLPSSGSAFPLGTTQVTCSATDASGNTNTCSFSVTVNPTIATVTWDGGGANSFWTNAANWVGDILPVNGDGLFFPTNAARLVNTNTAAGPTTLAFLELSGSNYVIFNPPLTLLNGLTNNPPPNSSNRLHAAITPGGDSVWRLAGIKTVLTLASNVTLANFKLTVDGTQQLEVEGDVNGSAGSQLLKDGNSLLRLNGPANAIPDLRVRDGTLVVGGALSGGLSISNGATLSGGGTVPPFVCAGSVMPIDVLTVTPGAASFLSGSTLDLFIIAGSTSPGTDYNQLKVATPPNLSGADLHFVLGYSPLVGESWVIITNTGASPFTTTFAGLPEGATFARAFNPPLRTNEFQITYAGGDGNDVVLTLTGYQSTGATRTWSGLGTNNLWMNPSNWVGNVAPNQGDDLLFPAGAARLINTNDFPAGSVFHAITVSGNSYVLNGNLLRINDGLHSLLPGGLGACRIPLTLTQPQTFTNSGGQFRFFAPIDNGGHDLTMRVTSGTNAFDDGAVISGAGDLVKEGAGDLFMVGTATNIYTGVTRVNEGKLLLAKSAVVTAVPGDLIIGDGVGGANADVVRVLAQSQITNSSEVSIASSGLLDLANNAETVSSISGSGAISLGSATLSLFSATGTNTFSGTISGTGGLAKLRASKLILTGTNTYTGLTTAFGGGTLQVDGFQPASLVRVGGAGSRLQGSGTVGSIDVDSNSSVLAPGSSPGILTCSNYNADGIGTGTFAVELSGISSGSGYDQLNARGTVNLTGQTLNASLNFLSALSNQFLIINNDGADAVVGTFLGRPEGSAFTIGSEQFRISYTGGDGNDVVLTQITGATNPVLTIQRSNNVLLVSWPTNASAFCLETTFNLAPPVTWQTVSSGITTNGAAFVFSVPNISAVPQQFFRLAFPCSGSGTPVALSIQLSNNLVTVSWPSNAFRLETTFNLAPPISWQTLSNGIANSGALRSFTFTNNPAVRNQFFRLAFP